MSLLFVFQFDLFFLNFLLQLFKSLTLHSTIQQKLLNCSIMFEITFIFLSCSFARRLQFTNFIVICFRLLYSLTPIVLSYLLVISKIRKREDEKFCWFQHQEKIFSSYFTSIIKVLGDTSLATTYNSALLSSTGKEITTILLKILNKILRLMFNGFH